MNKVIECGRMIADPEITFVPIGNQTIFVSRFCIMVKEDSFSCDDQPEEELTDYFECIAFDDAAKKIVDCFPRGAKIILSGILKNHLFEDSNGTKHYTNIIVISDAEFGDTPSARMRVVGGKKANDPDKNICVDLRKAEEKFRILCDNGFLAIKEDDYFDIAIRNMDRRR